MGRSTASGITLATALVVLTVVGVGVAPGAIRVRHDAPVMAIAGEPLRVEVSVTGAFAPEQLATADAVVATSGGPAHVPLSLESAALLVAEIPGELVAGASVSYYFRIVDTDGDEVLLPPGAPEGGVFAVEVFSAAGELSSVGLPIHEATGGIEVLAPVPGEIVEEVRPIVAALFDPPLDEPREVLVLLDGIDATDLADVGADAFVLAPPESLADGPHSVTVSVLTPARQVEATWTFFVRRHGGPEWAPPGEVPGLEFHGRVEVGWAAVVAETTATESTDVFLPYDEISRPTLDAYISGNGGESSFLLSAQYDPVYADDLAWSASVGTRRFDVEAGDVYPALSRTTLDWAVGEGAVLTARLGPTTTELVAMRVSEADTAGGFGIYSRFALGAKETFKWGNGSSAALVYVRAFDREGSVPEDQQLSDPLENDVIAGALSLGFGDVTVELEAAGSDATGEVDGAGAAVVARIGCAAGSGGRYALEYVASETSFYSAGSLELEPGEKGIKGEFSTRAHDALALSGYAGVYRNESSSQGVNPDDYELQTYIRADATTEALDGAVRGYCVARYDRVPYETYDYTYLYSMLGASYRRGRARGSLSGSWSRSDSDGASDVWTAGGEVRFDIVPRTWSVRFNGRLSFGSSDDGADDYTRTSLIAETRLSGDGHDLTVEYRLLDRDDESEPADSYTEHILRVRLGRAF